MPDHTRPIGIFDSGVGGLSVLREIRALLPQVPLLYVADSGFAPYGDKSQDFIRERSHAISAFLLEQGAGALVVACNTATAAAAQSLRERWPEVPIVAMEPAVKPATAATKRGVVGVLATVGTLASSQFAALLDTFGRSVEVLTQPGTGLVECVERGELDSPATRALLAAHLQPLLDGGADVIVLGCTHYVFLRPAIEAIVGPDVTIIDTGAAVARQLLRRLGDVAAPENVSAACRKDAMSLLRMWSSADPDTTARTVEHLLHHALAVAPLPAIAA